MPALLAEATHYLYVPALSEEPRGDRLVRTMETLRADSLITPVKKTTVQDENAPDRYPGDLKDPENVKSQVYYDERTGTYRLGTKLGDDENFLEAPFHMTPEEYQKWAQRRSMRAYYVQKNREAFVSKGKDKFDFSDMRFSLGPAEKIFGKGGVRLKTQGSAELKIGANTRFTDNPSLSERNRSVFGFDFDEKVNVSVNGSVGDKMNLDFNYNSEATFNFDTQNIKLKYEGKEDDIIKLIEAGNVSLPSNSSLITGASSLFGIRTDMQFGKLKLQTVISQKKTSSSSVQSSGGTQLTSYEFSADAYEANRHFFLSHFFRQHYDSWMSQLPTITSGLTINRVEIWVTNNTGTTTNTRNVICLTDLGEGSNTPPANSVNAVYATVTGAGTDVRNINSVSPLLTNLGLEAGRDFEKLESARLLSSSEYTVNTSLGYVSLRSTLQTDQVLAVAYEYTYGGQTYQVGEFASDIPTASNALIIKSLKNTANTPLQQNWRLMMKNVYSLGATSVQKEKFRLDIKWLSDTSGVYLTYLPEAHLKDKKLLQLLGADRLDNNNNRHSNAYFDFVEGYTINTSTGRVYFPVAEPFGAYLRSAIGNNTIADKYVFEELYDSTKTIAKQIAEKNKFVITGQYKATKTGEISLGTTNIPQGSVVVTAGGQTLTEGADYTVDYYGGFVTILNQSILDAGTPINASVESNSSYGMQRKTMLGLNWQYDFSKNLQIGGTFMRLTEQALTTKVAMGNEPLNNTIVGLNISYKKESQWLTDLLDKFPLLNVTQPSSINFTAEVAKLFVGKNNDSQGNASYIDDFENTKSEIDISTPTEWTLSSVPAMFNEAAYVNDVRYGYNRALLAWYYIDPLFTRRSSSLTPGYIKTDLNQLSDPYVREVYQRELFPNRQTQVGEASTLNVLNLAYYPDERGPYNLDPDLSAQGKLNTPAKRWGGMMRKLNTTDFETANVQYIEFWLMDPFVKADSTTADLTGDLYFNLGEISEDILKDGYKFYESGLPTEASSTAYQETVWGRVPNTASVTYAFNTSSGTRALQDVGYNGLSSEAEATYPAYQTYLQSIRGYISQTAYDSIAANPSGDRYHYFRGDDYDAARKTILERYKYINNPNGNSPEASGSTYSTAYKTTPDVEDINQDYTLNEYDKYYQYHVQIRPAQMQVGSNFIVDSRSTTVETRNGQQQQVTWYLFRIPVEQYETKQGNITDFSSIRFMRLFLTNFKSPVVLRFATLNLVHGEWRAYEQALYSGTAPAVSADLAVSAVNYEENNEKSPVNYVLPPGISRVVDPGQSQILQNDEQSLALTVTNLASGDARAVYKGVSLDLRRYKHLQMFSHANTVPGYTAVASGQTSIFLRLGTDYKNNFYEYEIPLTITPDNSEYGAGAASIVWPEENMFDFDLSLLTDIKRNRNKQKTLGTASNTKLYSEYDSEKPNNKISIMGNPSLGDVRTIMIGVRNNSRTVQSVEVWANELRLQNYADEGGWAAQAHLNVQLSDVATVNLSGHIETVGFGGLEQTVSQRRDNDLMEYSVTTNVQLGRFLPEKVKLQAPLYYSYSKQKTKPKYNPFDTDLTMEESEESMTKAQKDSLDYMANTVITNKNLSLTGVRFDIRASKRQPLPFDPANFTFGYAMSKRYTTGETTVWERDESWKWTMGYSYSPNLKTFEPFKGIKSRSKWYRILKDFGVNPVPQNLSINSTLTRTYYELQERDIENLDNNSLPLTWSSDFIWNRTLALRWDLTKNLHASFNSATNAEIQQPYTAVNKDLYPDRYTAWKDSVWTSIRHLGTPLTYAQNFEASWQLPLNKLPLFDWITSSVNYNANYNWTRGSELDDGTSLGNTIANARTLSGNVKLNLEMLYNHSPFLKKANQRFGGSAQKKTTPTPKRKFEREVQLLADTTVVLKHGQKTKKPRLSAIRPDGSRYALRYKVLDENSILILSQDTARIKVSITPKAANDEQDWYKTLQYVARGAMMLRNVNISYKNTFNMAIPGFLPNIGDILGQRSGGGLAPGLGFAFGIVDESYVEKALSRGWLLVSDSISTPATTSSTEDLQIRATLEPFRDFKIDLSATRNVNKSRSIQFMYSDMPTTQTGSFTMTTTSLSSAFASMGNAGNGYVNSTFTRFVSLLDKYQARVEGMYAGTTYPANSALAGQTFNTANGTVDKYSADVMIPAFLEAYTGSGGGISFFPTLSRLLPNWSVTYSGLSKLAAFKKIFKSFNLSHAYRSIYNVGSYGTFSSFVSLGGDLGFITDATTGLPVPSSMYDISTVSINESFSPLFGVNMTFLNNLTAKLELRRTRVLTLSMTSLQLTETRSNDYVVGFGYKVNNLNLFAPKKTVRSKKSDSTRNTSETVAPTNANKGFANDLNLKLDITLRNQSAVNRSIETLVNEVTSGSRSLNVSFSAEYALSKFLSLTAYYDRQMTTPLLTSSSYPVTTQDFGVSLRFSLTR